jgi:hypothetical protein
MTQNLNQFKPTTEKGALDLAINWNLYDCRIDPNSTADFTNANGFAVKLVSIAGSKNIIVDLATNATDKIFGFIPLETKTNSYSKGDFIRVGSSAVTMQMEASAAISGGADIEIVPTGNKVVTKTTGTSVGTALTSAAADGDLIKVLIKTL